MMMARSTPTLKRAGKSIAEFCIAYGVCRATFDTWRKRGLAPALTQPIPRGRAVITQESEEAWKRQHTALANVITHAAE
jgi:predicted short-subunit dehydrogenase-like oxidoreductase (DUF2520 family)